MSRAPLNFAQWTLAMITSLSLFWSGCSKKPDDRIAHNEDLNLFEKQALLLESPLNLAETEVVSGKVLQVKALDAKHRGLLAKTNLQNEDSISFSMTESYLTLRQHQGKSSEVKYKFKIKGHWDLAHKTNDDGDKSQYLVKNDTNNLAWQKRLYVEINPSDTLQVKASANLTTVMPKVIKKSEIADKCIKLADIRNDQLRNLVKSLEGQNEKYCFSIANSLLSIYADSMTEDKLLMTVSIEQHADIDTKVDEEGVEISNLYTLHTDREAWQERQYIVIDVVNAQRVKNLVQPNALRKDFFDGEFIYQQVVTQAHSENGIFMEGENLQSNNRLKFDIAENTITAYKLDEELNSSPVKTPFLRFPASLFDVGRTKNGINELTHVIGEDTEKPWNQRNNIRVSFDQNQIPGYLNDTYGVSVLFYGGVQAGASRMLGEVKVEGDLLWYETEETFTALPWNIDWYGENSLETSVIKVRHNFWRVDRRDFKPVVHTNVDFAKFGYFNTTKFGIDPKRGKTDDTLEKYASVYDITKGQNIVFKMNKEFPEKYRPIAKQVVDSWNLAFKEAVGRDEVIKLSDVADADIGDPRQNAMIWVPNRGTAQPLGLGSSVNDPATGEKLSGKAHVYGDGVNYVRWQAETYIDYVLGKITLDDLRSPSTFGENAEAGDAHDGNAIDSENVTKSIDVHAASAIAAREAQGFNATSFESLINRLSDRGPAEFQTVVKHRTTKQLAKDQRLFDSEKRQKELFALEHQGCKYEPSDVLPSVKRMIDAFPEMDRNEIIEEFTRRMIYNTLLHEVGHVLGLRHNFRGSFDEKNFSPEYWKEKAKPASEKRWIEAYRSTSVMDYTDTYEALAYGVGSYDTAAIKFGYGNKLNIVEEVDANGMVTKQTEIHRNEYNNKIEEIKNRAGNKHKTLHELDQIARKELNLREYMFCSDYETYDDPVCQRFDRGVTVSEIVNNLIKDYEVSSLLHSHRQGRREYQGYSRMYRYSESMRHFLLEFIYKLVKDSFDSAPASESVNEYYKAVTASVEFLYKVIGSVEPGNYRFDEEAKMFVPEADQTLTLSKAEAEINPQPDDKPNPFNANEVIRNKWPKKLVVNELAGKPLLPEYTQDGLETVISRRGFEDDKITALFALSDRSIGSDKYARENLGFSFMDFMRIWGSGDVKLKGFDTYKTFKSILLGEYVTTQSFVETSKNNFVPLEVAPANAARPTRLNIKASSNLTTEMYAAFSLILGHQTSKDSQSIRSYLDFRTKGVDDFFPAGTETVSFVNRAGTQEFVVPQTKDKQSVAFALAAQAANLTSKGSELAMLNDVNYINPKLFNNIVFTTFKTDVIAAMNKIDETVTTQPAALTAKVKEFRELADKASRNDELSKIINSLSTLKVLLASARAPAELQNFISGELRTKLVEQQKKILVENGRMKIETLMSKSYSNEEAINMKLEDIEVTMYRLQNMYKVFNQF